MCDVKDSSCTQSLIANRIRKSGGKDMIKIPRWLTITILVLVLGIPMIYLLTYTVSALSEHSGGGRSVSGIRKLMRTLFK